MSERETVDITNERGVTKKYETVASRVNRFREKYPDWFIHTKIITVNDTVCTVKVEIGWASMNVAGDPVYFVAGTGHAEEYRHASEINQTSALENAETSAIGRALAAVGFASADSYASANEIQSAIAARKSGGMDTPSQTNGGADLRPGALIVLQQAAANGLPALEFAWKKTLTEPMREACKGDIAKLKREAAERTERQMKDFDPPPEEQSGS